MTATQTIDWQPIETLPKNHGEVIELYTARNSNDFQISLLIARAYSAKTVMGGCVAECYLTPEGKWGYITPPIIAEIYSDVGGGETTKVKLNSKPYSYIHEPTHWALIPSPPTLP